MKHLYAFFTWLVPVFIFAIVVSGMIKTDWVALLVGMPVSSASFCFSYYWWYLRDS